MSVSEKLQYAAVISIAVLGGGVTLLILITLVRGWWDRRHTPTRVDAWAKQIARGSSDFGVREFANAIDRLAPPASTGAPRAAVTVLAQPDDDGATPPDADELAILQQFDSLVAELTDLTRDRDFHNRLVEITREFDRRALMVELESRLQDAVTPTLAPVGAHRMEE